MGVVIYGVGLILGLAFLTVFFVEICRDGRKPKPRCVTRVDTERPILAEKQINGRRPGKILAMRPNLRATSFRKRKGA